MGSLSPSEAGRIAQQVSEKEERKIEMGSLSPSEAGRIAQQVREKEGR